jgi:hypothetical protein
VYHIILIAITATMTLGVWNLVHSSPRSIALLLPPQVAFAAGGFLLTFGSFFAFAAAVLVQNGGAMLAFLLQAHVGLYFLLARFREDEDTIRRAFLMMGAMLLTIIAIFYVQNTYAAALLMIGLLAAGYHVLTGSPRYPRSER